MTPLLPEIAGQTWTAWRSTSSNHGLYPGRKEGWKGRNGRKEGKLDEGMKDGRKKGSTEGMKEGRKDEQLEEGRNIKRRKE
jgi:hypothetical protein